MRLKNIEINGFKSFADKIKLNFETNITAIVGPNGSGKSNVVDAIRWVLGEQSAKSLRGNRMEDVIFSGTDTKSKKNVSSVSITFDNTDKKIPIEYNEVTITRKLFRNGDSEYYINKSIVRLKEIRELFFDTGIGREGYSIIGQGKIEEIINGKSEDRRLIFEEASGISKIKYKKNESEKKLYKTKENLIRLKDIILKNKERFEYLKIQSEKAKRGKLLTENIEKADFSISYTDYNKSKIQFEKLQSEYLNLKKDFNYIEKEYNIVNEKIQPTKIKLDKLSNKIEELNSEYNTLMSNKIELNSNKELLEEKNVFLLERKNKNFEEIDELKNELNKLKSDESLNNESKESKKNVLKSLLTERKEVEKEHDLCILKLNNEKENNSILKNKYEELSGKVNDLESNKKANEILRLDYDKRKKESTIEKNNLKIKANGIEKSLELKRKNIDSKKIELEDIFNLISDSKLKLEENIKESKNIENDIKKIDNEILYKSKELQLLNNFLNNHEGYNKSVQDLFKLTKNNSNISNLIFGTLGDLITVEDRFKKAIDTVLSSNLQGIVVDNSESAKIIIKKIKEEKIGRLNFFPIDSIKPKQKNKEVNLNSDLVLCIANEVVKCDLKYKDIVDYFLSKTIICENIDTAILLSKQYNNKYRIVTLDGDIISNWGSISGGYKSYKNSYSLIGRKNKLDELNAYIENLKNIKIKKEDHFNNFKKNIEFISKEINDTEINYSNINNYIIEVEKNIYKEQLDLDLITVRLDEIEKNENKENQGNSFNEVNLENLKLQLVELKSNIDNSNLEISNFNYTNQDIEKKLYILTNDIETLERDMALAENVINQILEKKHTIENKINVKTNEVSKFNTDINNNIENISISENNLKITIEKIEEIKIDIEKNINEKKKSQEVFEKLNSSYEDLNEKYYNFKNNIDKTEVKLSSIESQLKNIVLKLCDEYSISEIECENKMLSYSNLSFTKTDLKKFREDLRELGSFSYDSIEEFEKVEKELEFQIQQEQDLHSSINDINKIIIKLEKEMRKTFIEKFELINYNFSNIFKKLFNGGEAKLTIDGDDILNCGIDIIAKPIGKKMQTLSLMSGGEKSLTAVALLFAIFETKPSPFCILDEIDAALDDSNILRYIDYLKNFLVETQFLMITHRKPTMEMADMIYGVTMEEKGVSKIVSMKLNEMGV